MHTWSRLLTTMMISAALLVGALVAPAGAAPNIRSQAQIDVEYISDCTRVVVAASQLVDSAKVKKLSFVTIEFVDGTSMKFKDLSSALFRYESIDPAIASVTAKSGTTTVSVDCVA